MSDYAVINLKTDPKLKKEAALVAQKLGVSISAVLNNELRRFASEQSVVFERQEMPNQQTSEELKRIESQIEKGDYLKFENNEESVDFLSNELA